MSDDLARLPWLWARHFHSDDMSFKEIRNVRILTHANQEDVFGRVCCRASRRAVESGCPMMVVSMDMTAKGARGIRW